jgi:hypothetical protein
MAEINGLTPINAGIYGELEAAVIREALYPMEPEEAQKIVDAVLGPLRLLPPRPRDAWVCHAANFSLEGQWQNCILDHEAEPEDPQTHQDTHGECWDDGDPRSVPVSYDPLPTFEGDQ